jgi:hypothetical protein
MYSIQEIVRDFKPNLDKVERHMDGKSSFHPRDISLLTDPEIKAADRLKIKQSVKEIPLGYLMEFLMADGTSDLAGAAYLVPDKIYDILFEAGAVNDIVPLCAPVVSCPGSSLKVDVEVDGSFKAHFGASGGSAPSETVQTTQVTITPKLFQINPVITQELIEDSQFDMMEFHLRRAGEQMGQFSTEQYLAAMISGADGDGTQNTCSTGTNNACYLSDLAESWAANLEDGFLSDTVILPPTLLHTVLADDTIAKYSDQFHSKGSLNSPLNWGSFLGMNIVLVKHMNTDYTGDGALYISSKWHAFVQDKANASLVVRKRWMKIDRYAKPVEDLVGAVISARQDEATIYNDASCEITATA